MGLEYPIGWVGENVTLDALFAAFSSQAAADLAFLVMVDMTSYSCDILDAWLSLLFHFGKPISN